MDEIEDRLKTTSENCIEAYIVWNKDRKDVKTRESLQDAVHELRKVAARLEIEIAASERSDGSQRKIPIPHHRSSRKKINNGEDNKGPEDKRPVQRRQSPKKTLSGS